MRRRKRLEAHPIDRILDKKTGKLVGWLYQWDDNELVPMWKDGRKSDVIYESGSMFSLKSGDNDLNLNTVQSSCEDTLRALGAAYMQDPNTKGSLTLYDPSDQIIATFDVWTNDWKSAVV